MLKLRKIELIGFKSFTDRTILSLGGRGITSIVGPNGCGKSNIVDAITWVLGEQSHKSLRAERMADCISNGSALRAPVGMAEVSLTMVDHELAEAAEKILSRAEQAASENAPAETADADATEPSPAPVGLPAPATGEPAAPVEAVKGALARRKRLPAPLQLNPGEVVITRRLYRSGQSEYLINGRQARLRDIQDLFMGMGLGPNSYAIIEQGRIGQILSSRPAERRAILEEAAGVSKFKTKKRLAEAKLESSKLNLSRVNDILVEITKQLNSLKRQASRARRYAELREEMRAVLASVLAARWGAMTAEGERLTAELAGLRDQEAGQATRFGELEAEQQQLEARAYELESQLRENQNQANQAALETDRTRNRIAYNRRQDEQIEFQIGQMDLQAGEAAERARAAQARLESQNVAVVGLRQQKAELEAAVEELAARAQALANEERMLDARQAEFAAEMKRLAEAISRAQVASAEAGEARRHHDEALAQEENAAAGLGAEAERQRAAFAEAETRWNDALRRAETAGRHLGDLQTRLGKRQQEHSAAAAEAAQCREQLAGTRARHTSLERIVRERAYTGGSIQKLLGMNGDGEKRGFQAAGLVSDYAEVEGRYESAVEQFLREELDYVVVESFDSARAGVALLRGELGGRATFFVDSLGSAQVDPAAPSPLEKTPGVVARMDRLVNFRRPLGEAAKRYLPRLRTGFLVETATVAERLANQHSDMQFVTVDGTWYQGRLVGGGKPGEAGPLALKRELRQVEAETARQQAWLGEAATRLATLENAVAELAGGIERAQAEAQEAEMLSAAASQQREYAQAESLRIASQLAACIERIGRWRAERDTAAARLEAAQRRFDQATAAARTGETELAGSAERLALLRQQSAAEHDRLAVRRAELAGMTERLAAGEAAAQTISSEQDELAARVGQMRRERADFASRRQQLAADSASAEGELQALAGRAAELAELGRQLDEGFRGARSRSLELGDTLRGARLELDRAREERSRVEVERARLESEIEHLRQACQSELGCSPEQIVPVDSGPGTPEELASAEANYREMKERLESMGPINMMALDEYKECEDRFEFLTREKDDLVRSIADTEQAIVELDRVSREKFEQAFTQINGYFTQAFTALFGGGVAEMRLGEADSGGEPGLDIVAQPPGKRLQNVMLLSGGEKALTALALLIAIFRYQPSPFCVLDEVDAPLDESNVVRFNRMLAEMSGHTQFLVVTHNRRTMEMATVLYGVTMQEPGISRIVSVRWEEAESDAA
ncbi:MAG TPA: chromosome segregation protein SMC [Candidatus Acidoferrales bacterium]|nr:chromosome segregation protein SMC [Candidatus Acidoferrales bacterium]